MYEIPGPVPVGTVNLCSLAVFCRFYVIPKRVLAAFESGELDGVTYEDTDDTADAESTSWDGDFNSDESIAAETATPEPVAFDGTYNENLSALDKMMDSWLVRLSLSCDDAARQPRSELYIGVTS